MAEPLRTMTPFEVELDCRLSADRRVDDCKVVYEYPPGLGLASTRRALIENQNYRVPETLLQSAKGGRIRLNIPGAMIPSRSRPGAGSPALDVKEVYRLRVSGGFYGRDYQSIAVRKIIARDGAFWMVEQRKRGTIGAHDHTIRIERRWVDGRNCPALAPLIESISAILRPPAPPRPQPERLPFAPYVATIPDVPKITPFHGNTTYLGVLKDHGAYAVQSDYEGAITTWWRTTEQKLADCWGYSGNLVDGAELPLTLETDADEAPYIALERANGPA